MLIQKPFKFVFRQKANISTSTGDGDYLRMGGSYKVQLLLILFGLWAYPKLNTRFFFSIFKNCPQWECFGNNRPPLSWQSVSPLQGMLNRGRHDIRFVLFNKLSVACTRCFLLEQVLPFCIPSGDS